MSGQRGLTFVEVLVASLIGAIVILALGSLYLATTRAFAVSESQAALQRQGQLALDEIAFQARRASQVDRLGPACPPAGSNGPSLWVRVEPLPGQPLPQPEWRPGDYCFYAGTGDNEAPAGALCARHTATGDPPGTGPCRNLLGGGGQAPGGGAALGMVREGVPLGVRLVLQTADPPDARCDLAALPGLNLTAGSLPQNSQFCFVAGTPAAGSTEPPHTTVAFAINDQINALTFGITLMLRNVRD